MSERKMNESAVSQNVIEEKIFTIRGHRVILDSDLAKIYAVTTKRLNEQIKRNFKRFPEDFVFQLTKEEAEELQRSRSQIATLKKGQNIKYLPYAFTEHGAIMAANVLNSPRAVQMSVFVVRAFVRLRGFLASNKLLADKLDELEKKLTDRLNVHEKAILHILEEIKKLMTEPPAIPIPEKPKRRIGFHNERALKH